MADSLQKILLSRFKKKPLAKQIMSGMVVEFANGLMREFWGKKGHELVRVIGRNNPEWLKIFLLSDQQISDLI